MERDVPSERAPILIVDDRPANRQALEAVLEPLKYPIVAVESGEEAITYLSANEVALIVLDVQMPGLDGFQTLARIRELQRLRDIPVVFVSAVYGDAEHEARGYALGAVDYIAKPYDPALMVAKMRSLIGLHERGEELRRNAEELARERATRAERERILGIVSHDLRSPLTTIRSGADFLVAHGRLDDTETLTARRIQRNADRMARLISDLLDFTRLQSGPLVIRRTETDLGELVTEAVEDIQSAVVRPVDLSVETRCRASVDKDRLVQAISNLTLNAVQHSAAEARISVILREQGDIVELTVWNEGELKTQDLALLFEPFRRGERSNGAGLGLYITQQIARAHGGDIEVSSTAASGTTFRVTLPVSHA
jgi:signal transduction histidine kinase